MTRVPQVPGDKLVSLGMDTTNAESLYRHLFNINTSTKLFYSAVGEVELFAERLLQIFLPL